MIEKYGVEDRAVQQRAELARVQHELAQLEKTASPLNEEHRSQLKARAEALAASLEQLEK